MKKLITLNAPGLYIAEHNPTGKVFLVSIIGEVPMLRIRNIMDLSAFTEGKPVTLQENEKLSMDMWNNPNEYTYALLRTKLLLPNNEVKEDTLDLSNYPSLVEKKDKLLDMDDDMAVVEICKDENLNIATATEIWKQFKLSIRK